MNRLTHRQMDRSKNRSTNACIDRVGCLRPSRVACTLALALLPWAGTLAAGASAGLGLADSGKVQVAAQAPGGTGTPAGGTTVATPAPSERTRLAQPGAAATAPAEPITPALVLAAVAAVLLMALRRRPQR